MIDLHCHILPGIDDGAESLDESLAMARSAVEDGIHAIVATPHTLNGIYTNPVKKVISRVADLKKIFSENHIDLRLYTGADVHLCPQMLDLIKSGDAGTIDNAGKFILLELPPQAIPQGLKDEIFSLKLNAITPIITHPERNPAIQQDIGILHELVRIGALCQITSTSITGDFGSPVLLCSEKLLKHRLVHVIASDAHSADRRPPVLSRAVEAAAEILGSYDEAMKMVTDIPASILLGDMPDIPEPVPAK